MTQEQDINIGAFAETLNNKADIDLSNSPWGGKQYFTQRWPATTLAQGEHSDKTITIKNKTGRPFYLTFSGNQNAVSSSSWGRFYLYKGSNLDILRFTTIVSVSSSMNVQCYVDYLDTDVVAGQTYTYTARINQNSNSANYGEEGANEAPTFTVFEI